VGMSAKRPQPVLRKSDDTKSETINRIRWSRPLRRNLPYLQVEFRQHQVQDAEAQVRWAQRFATVLRRAFGFTLHLFLCKM